MKAKIIFRDVEIGEGSEGAALMALTTHFGPRRKVEIGVEEDKCEQCVFWVRAEVDGIGQTLPEDTPLGHCRRYAPSRGYFPFVLKNEWCGEFHPKEPQT